MLANLYLFRLVTSTTQVLTEKGTPHGAEHLRWTSRVCYTSTQHFNVVMLQSGCAGVSCKQLTHQTLLVLGCSAVLGDLTQTQCKRVQQCVSSLRH